MDFPNKKYKIILADPPWEYNEKITGGSNKISGSEMHYNVLNLDIIKNLPISDIALPDSYLFLWATSPLLPEALDVMKSWKYTYKCAIYWDKIYMGLGHWFRGQVEVCLVGIRGNVRSFHSQERNIIRVKSIKHSKKPDQLYNIIENLNINPKIELFARDHREGWDVWGY